MKKIILLVLLPVLAFSQSKYLAFDIESGASDPGSIITIDDNNNAEVSYNFVDNGIPFDRLVEINGTLYGITDNLGASVGRILYKYDFTNETFEVLMHFDRGDEYSKLIAGGGKLYLVKVNFLSGASIIEIDPTTLDVSSLFSLDDYNIDSNNFFDFIYAPNHKLYGITQSGGANDEGTLFSYDLTSGTYRLEYEFGSTMGTWPIHIMAHSNGKTYGVTRGGGTNGEGIIYEFDPSNNVFTKLYDLTSSDKAYTLTEGDTNKLYGFTNPRSGGGGRIYQFDIATNTFTNLHYFSTGLEGSYSYLPLVYKNHILYGTNRTDITHEGMLFSYDISNDVFNDYTIYTNYQTLPLVKTQDERFFFATEEDLFDTCGALYEFDTTSNIINRLNGIEYGTKGVNPVKMIISSNNGLVYGITNSGPLTSDYGSRLFSYNYETGEYRMLINFSIEDYGEQPNNIIESSNGLIYVTTGYTSGFAGEGKIIEYNPYNNTHAVVHSFSSEYDGTSYTNDPIYLVEENNVIYGYKKRGGGSTLHNGTIFSFDTVTHTYSILYESADLENVNSIFSTHPNNKFYGITTVGGNNNEGYIFSFDIHSNSFNIIESLNQAGESYLTQTDNGNVYGILQYSHGVDGSIFKIDTNDNFSVYYQFDNANIPSTGFNPDYITSIGNNLYIITFGTSSGSWSTRNLLTEVNTNTGSFRNIADMEGFGRQIYKKSYMMDDNRLIGNSVNGLYSYYQGDNAINFLNLSSDIFGLIDITNASVSVPAFTLKNNLEIYPNPVSKYISIKIGNSSSIAAVSIFNFLGKQIMKKMNTNKIDVSNLKDGIYFIKVRDIDGNITVSKIIKKSP